MVNTRLTGGGACGMRKRAIVCQHATRGPYMPSEPKAVTRDKVLDAGALKPGYNWSRQLPAPGHSRVDFEERVNFRRLHDYRLGRARKALLGPRRGAILCFDNNSIRYLTSTVSGEWSRDKMCRFALLTGNGEPWLWDFGSAAVHHRLFAPWLPKEHCLAGMVGLRGSVAPEVGLFKRAASEIKSILKEQGVAGMPLGLDIAELPLIFALEEAGLEVRDGQQTMLDARQIKNIDEIVLLNMSAAMVDGVYQVIAEALKPGVRECDIVALANKSLYQMGSDDVEGINAIAGERCSPHPHNFTDRIIRPGDQAFFDIIQSVTGYRTCYYRTFNVGQATDAQREAYRKAREWMDAALSLVKPGVTTDQIAACWPTAEEFGFANDMEAFALQFGHGLGLALHERPIISRLVSFDQPMEIQEGMAFALEA